MKAQRMPIEHRERNVKSFKKKICQLWQDSNVKSTYSPIIIDTNGNPIQRIITEIQQSSLLKTLAASSSDSDQ